MPHLVRIFRVQVPTHLHEEFEPLFQTTSTDAVEKSEGFLSATIGKPTKHTPDEYIMVSAWKDETSLTKFAGQDWNKAYIPTGMEKYVQRCWVHHYRTFD